MDGVMAREAAACVEPEESGLERARLGVTPVVASIGQRERPNIGSRVSSKHEKARAEGPRQTRPARGRCDKAFHTFPTYYYNQAVIMKFASIVCVLAAALALQCAAARPDPAVLTMAPGPCYFDEPTSPSLCCSRARSPNPVMGGWSPVRRDDSVEQTMQLAADEWLGAGNTTEFGIDGCDDPLLKYLDACSQVVAGTNYRVLFSLQCPGSNATVALKVQAYLPLPQTNEPLQIEEPGVIVVTEGLEA